MPSSGDLLPDTLAWLLAVMLPLASLAVVGRLLVAAWHARRRPLPAVLALGAAVLMLLLTVAVASPWYLHGLSPGRRGDWNDLLLLAGPAMIVLGAALGLWGLARRLDRLAPARTVLTRTIAHPIEG